MEKDMEGLNIRQATLEDKQAVLDINDNVYDGRDYLKALYEEEFIGSPHTKSYIAVYDNKIVGFAAGTIVDDGQTVISRAARINEEYSNMGIYKMLKNHISTKSGASIDAFAIDDESPAVNSSSFQQKNRLIQSMMYEIFNISPNDTRLQQKAIATYQIKPTNLLTSLLQEYFERGDYRKYLFPKERIIVGWVPYRTIASNIPLLWTRSEHCNRITDVRMRDNGITGLVSNLTTFLGVSGDLVGLLGIFGTDINSLKCHLTSHFEFLSKRNETGISLCVLVPKELGNENVENTFGDFGLKKLRLDINSPLYPSAINLYERNLTSYN